MVDIALQTTSPTKYTFIIALPIPADVDSIILDAHAGNILSTEAFLTATIYEFDSNTGKSGKELCSVRSNTFSIIPKAVTQEHKNLLKIRNGTRTYEEGQKKRKGDTQEEEEEEDGKKKNTKKSKKTEVPLIELTNPDEEVLIMDNSDQIAEIEDKFSLENVKNQVYPKFEDKFSWEDFKNQVYPEISLEEVEDIPEGISLWPENLPIPPLFQ